MKGHTATIDKTRIAVMCECGGFFEVHASWQPDEDIPNLIRNAMHCRDCDHKICFELLDHGADSVEIHSITPSLEDD